MDNTQKQRLKEISLVALKLGCFGFGGIAGMVGLIENEMVTKRKWISRSQYLDVVGAANVIPGPNSVEIIMHCSRVRAGKAGLVLGGLCYILPAVIICLFWASLYTRFNHLPSVQPFIYGIRPATTAIVLGALFRLSKDAFKSRLIILLSLLVLAGSLYGMNEVVLLFSAGIIGTLYLSRSKLYSLMPLPFIIAHKPTTISNPKLFFIFLKIGAILYGSGYILFAYLDDALVQRNHWLTKQQLIDAISVGQITPGPIFSSATFAGYLVSGISGALLATVGIFLPSFFIAFFLHRLLHLVEKHQAIRNFLDIINGASVALIAAVAIHMLSDSITQWQSVVILVITLAATLVRKINVAWLVIFGSVAGYLLAIV
ncbi:MAG TPA: chromate efflux transporter [Flavipsychrobacter sp.]|nr:chromate efflux transporter [Flavipsychrobacter sp.]